MVTRNRVGLGGQAVSRESRALEEHMDGYISFMADYKFANPPSIPPSPFLRKPPYFLINSFALSR
jgi:hypothetical protein